MSGANIPPWPCRPGEASVPAGGRDFGSPRAARRAGSTRVNGTAAGAVRSALSQAALGIRDLALDDRIEDGTQGRQLGKRRSAVRRRGEGRQRLQLARLEEVDHRNGRVGTGHLEIYLFGDEFDEGL